MIVICNGAGQLCNRIKEFAHCIATGLSNGEQVINLKFFPYIDYFEFQQVGIDVRCMQNEKVYNVLSFLERI